MNARLLIAMVPATAALLICFAANLRAKKAQKYDVHVKSAMGACSRLIAWVFAAVLSLVAASAFAKSRKSRQRDPCRRMRSGNFALARPVNRTILLSQKPAESRLPSCSPKKNMLMDSQKRWVERLATQTSFGRRTQNALHLTFSRARPIKRRNFMNSTGTPGASSIR